VSLWATLTATGRPREQGEKSLGVCFKLYRVLNATTKGIQCAYNDKILKYLQLYIAKEKKKINRPTRTLSRQLLSLPAVCSFVSLFQFLSFGLQIMKGTIIQTQAQKERECQAILYQRNCVCK